MHHPHLDNEINISSSTIVRVLLFGLLFWVLFLIKDLILVVLAAVIIASSIEPLTKWFATKRVGRVPATVIVYVAIGLLLAGFTVFFLPAVMTEALAYLNALPASINLNDLWNPIQETGFVGKNLSLGLSSDFSIREIVSGIQSVVSGTTGEGVFKTTSTIFGGALSFILMIVLSFYLAVQEDGVGNFLRLITPTKSHEYVINLWKRSQLKIGLWMQGQLLLGVIIGMLVYLGLVILGIKHALLLASLAAVFEIIPVFGPLLSAIPAVIVAFADRGTSWGFVVVGLYVLIHLFENNLFYPLVVKKIVGISPIVVILSLIIGAKLAGFLGILISVPLSAAFMEYINDVERRKIAEII